MSRPEKVFVLCPECKGNGYFNPNNTSCGGVPDGWIPDPAAPKDKETLLDLCKYCEGTGHVGWQRTFEGSYGDCNE